MKIIIIVLVICVCVNTTYHNMFASQIEELRKKNIIPNVPKTEDNIPNTEDNVPKTAPNVPKTEDNVESIMGLVKGALKQFLDLKDQVNRLQAEVDDLKIKLVISKYNEEKICENDICKN